MFGRIFESTFTGSMVGAGCDVHAVWAYVIAHVRDGTVEVNPILVGAVLGCTPERVEAAMAYLCQPDPRSRNPAHDGRRLLHEGGYQYHVVSHARYRAIRNDDERRAYNREKQRESRARRGEASSGVKRPVIDKPRLSASSEADADALPLPSAPTTTPHQGEERAPRKRGTTRSPNGKDTLDRILRAFGRMWATRYERPFVPVPHAKRLIASLLHAPPEGFPAQLHVAAILVAMETYLDDGGYPAREGRNHPLGLFVADPTGWFPAADDARVLDWAARISAAETPAKAAAE